jgi:hypothetical protein
MRLLPAVHPPEATQAILTCLALPARAPPLRACHRYRTGRCPARRSTRPVDRRAPRRVRVGAWHSARLVKGPAWLLLHAAECPTSRDWLSRREAEQAERSAFRSAAPNGSSDASPRSAPSPPPRGGGERARGARDPKPSGRLPAPLPGRRATPGDALAQPPRRCGLCAIRLGADALGCDVELVERRSEAFVRDYLDADERARVEARPPDRDWLVPLGARRRARSRRSVSGSRSTRARSASVPSKIAKAKAGARCASSSNRRGGCSRASC